MKNQISLRAYCGPKLFRFMPEPSKDELQESINELIAYRDRLKNEVITISQKLQLPKKKIEATLAENSELNQIERMLEKLNSQKEQKP